MRNTLYILLTILAVTVPASSVQAMKVADISRIGGARTNVLTGLGLVVGLKGTGDGGAYLPAIRPLASMLAKFSDASSVAELTSAANVAVVTLTATVPANGVRNGDPLDVYITSNGDATSLKGGRLFVSPMMGPTGSPYTPRDASGNALRPIPYALAQGAIDLEDPSTPTSGVVKSGAVMEVDLPAKYIDSSGRFTIILDDPSASWVTASTIAKLINGSGDTGDELAVALDPKNIIVTIPASERDRPDNFIAGVLRLPVPLLSTEAKVQINDRTGTMIITGDVEISPVVISHKGLTITTVVPQQQPDAAQPAGAHARHDPHGHHQPGRGPPAGFGQRLRPAESLRRRPHHDRQRALQDRQIARQAGGGMSNPMSHISHHGKHWHGHVSPAEKHQQLTEQTEKWVSQTFFGTLLKQMRDSPFKSELMDGGRGGEMFGTMFDQQLADHMGRSAGQKLVKTLVRKIEGANAYQAASKAFKTAHAANSSELKRRVS